MSDTEKAIFGLGLALVGIAVFRNIAGHEAAVLGLSAAELWLLGLVATSVVGRKTL